MRSFTLAIIALTLSACAAAPTPAPVPPPAPDACPGTISLVRASRLIRMHKSLWQLEQETRALLAKRVQPYSVVLALPGGWNERFVARNAAGSAFYDLTNGPQAATAYVDIHPLFADGVTPAIGCIEVEKNGQREYGFVSKGITFDDDGRGCGGILEDAAHGSKLTFRQAFQPTRTDFVIGIQLWSPLDADPAKVATEIKKLFDNVTIITQ